MEYKYETIVDDLRVQYTIENFDYDEAYTKQNLFLKELDKAYDEINNLTNHADGYDYAISVSCGIICGIIDIFIVDEWDFARGKKRANIDVNNKIIQFAKKQPEYLKFCDEHGRNPDKISTAIEFLETKFPLPGDAPWLCTGYDINGNVIKDKKISPKSHHLDDLSHHPTIVGLIACIIAQFTGTGTYINSDNQIVKIPFDIDEDGNIEGKTPIAKVSAGIINWFFNVAKNRYGHLMSDMGGTKNKPGGGMGIPGTVMSLLKELSCLPCFNDSDFSKKLARAFQKGIGTKSGQINLGVFNCLFEGADSKIDYRTENAIKNELKRQCIPVAINETVVRSFYFIKHFIIEMKDKKNIDKIDIKNIIPINNRTIVRMIAISSGTFSAIDMVDAAINGVVKSGGNTVELGRQILLRVNFVGIGRFTMAVGMDAFMEIRKRRLELAITCAEIAKTSVLEQRIIEETEKINNETNTKIEKMKKISDQITKLKF